MDPHGVARRDDEGSAGRAGHRRRGAPASPRLPARPCVAPLRGCGRSPRSLTRGRRAGRRCLHGQTTGFFASLLKNVMASWSEVCHSTCPARETDSNLAPPGPSKPSPSPTPTPPAACSQIHGSRSGRVRCASRKTYARSRAVCRHHRRGRPHRPPVRIRLHAADRPEHHGRARRPRPAPAPALAGPVTCSTGTSGPTPEPRLGRRFHLRADLVGVRLRRVRERPVLPLCGGVVGLGHQRRDVRRDPPQDGDLAPGPALWRPT
jgi:hypothetical protein